MAVSLDPSVLDQLNTTEARALHELTDQLSSCGVGNLVNLPQIIVVGEQSAGKSSVLEAISHVRFPVKGDSKAPQAFQRAGFREDDLADIIKEAKDYMGIAATGRDFSKDVLRLEIEGPNMYPLTLVDLPGLFHVETANQSMRGKETVDQLVESYMKQKNSIILVVITASNQLANHIALRKVKEHDPKRERTLGVITKPDLTRAGYTEERNYIQLARNQESAHKLKLGWHVLRNRAEDEDNLDARDATEARFFETTAWASIPRDDRGVISLRKKLSRVLYNHIRHNLHGVIEDIEGKLRERQEELERLGLSRSTPQEMRSFLLAIAGEFQRLARDGIHGRYNDAFFGGLRDTEHKLRAQLRNFNRAFDYVLATKGSKLAIAPRDDLDCQSPDLPEFLKSFLEEYPYDFPNPASISRERLNALLEKRAATNQGREFPGSHNTDLVIQLFQKQAAPWKDIASFHVKQVTLVAKAFVDHLFRHIVGQPETTEAILCGCVDPFFTDKEKLLSQKLEELLKPYVRGYAMPLDAEFRHMVTRRTVDRLAEQLRAMSEKQAGQIDDATVKTLRSDMLADAASTLEAIDGGEFGTEKVIDMMEAYYEMSRRTFTDTVINLAIESCLICDLPDILTPTQVDRMDEKQLRELAAESEDAHSRREQLDGEIAVLRQGLEQCRKYKPRGMTVVPSAQSRLVSASASDDTTGKLIQEKRDMTTVLTDCRCAVAICNTRQSSCGGCQQVHDRRLALRPNFEGVVPGTHIVDASGLNIDVDEPGGYRGALWSSGDEVDFHAICFILFCVQPLECAGCIDTAWFHVREPLVSWISPVGRTQGIRLWNEWHAQPRWASSRCVDKAILRRALWQPRYIFYNRNRQA
ncbi:Interferon-induced GTP-binding protein Mx3, partial [Tolypocladium paradoxum]